jgi:hypothetical protein
MGTQHMMTFKEHRYSSTSSQPEENHTKNVHQTGLNRVRRTSTLVEPITDIRDFTGSREFNLIRPMKQFSKIPVDEPVRRMSTFSG